MHYARGYIGGAHFEPNSLSAPYALAVSDSRVNCKVSGYREIWEPRAAAGIRAIHRMQICTGAFLGGRRLSPRASRYTAFTTLILASAVSSLCGATRLHGKNGYDGTLKILLDTDLKV